MKIRIASASDCHRWDKPFSGLAKFAKDRAAPGLEAPDSPAIHR
jgi:hypothetical protein